MRMGVANMKNDRDKWLIVIMIFWISIIILGIMGSKLYFEWVVNSDLPDWIKWIMLRV